MALFLLSFKPGTQKKILFLSGCSSISALLFQNGPLAVKLDVYNGTLSSLVSTTYSWTKTSSIIYLDQPVGTGFSYPRTHLVDKPSDSGEAKRIHEFLHKIYRSLLATYWANDESVRKALHIKKKSVGEWVRCNRDLPYISDIISSVPYHMNNSINGYRSLIFSGDHDTEVPYLGAQAWIRSFNYSLVDDWRPWMIEDQIAGYTRTYANKMTFATVKASYNYSE